jgi:hypothetical protein
LSKCPYCKEELELKIEIKPTPIDDKFRNDILNAYEGFIEIQAEFALISIYLALKR